jgi:hypothetical protein
LFREELSGKVFLKLYKVFFQRVRADSARGKHSGSPLRIVGKRLGRTGFDGAGQEIHMKTGIRRAELPAAFSVTNGPLRMCEKKLVCDGLRHVLLYRAEPAGELKTIGNGFWHGFARPF